LATYAITTAVNIDSLAAKAGSDTYNINGGYLTVDQDTRYGANQNTSAAMGNLTLSATLGGTVEFTSVGVRLIAYTAGTGNVPAYGTTISRGSASATLLTVYATLASAPTAVGAAMPATGFIKVRGWNLTEYTAGALTGIGATASGASVPGWLEIVGVDVLTQTCNRLGTYKVRGDWFALGTTDGVRATTYQVPSHGSLVHLPGVWVETAAASGVYEFYPNAGSAAATSAVFGTEELRGRVCWVSTAGLVRFGHDGTTSTGGFIPESGRKVRIPSIMFVCHADGVRDHGRRRARHRERIVQLVLEPQPTVFGTARQRLHLRERHADRVRLAHRVVSRRCRAECSADQLRHAVVALLCRRNDGPVRVDARRDDGVWQLRPELDGPLWIHRHERPHPLVRGHSRQRSNGHATPQPSV